MSKIPSSKLPCKSSPVKEPVCRAPAASAGQRDLSLFQASVRTRLSPSAQAAALRRPAARATLSGGCLAPRCSRAFSCCTSCSWLGVAAASFSTTGSQRQQQPSACAARQPVKPCPAAAPSCSPGQLCLRQAEPWPVPASCTAGAFPLMLRLDATKLLCKCQPGCTTGLASLLAEVSERHHCRGRPGGRAQAPACGCAQPLPMRAGLLQNRPCRLRAGRLWQPLQLASPCCAPCRQPTLHQSLHAQRAPQQHQRPELRSQQAAALPPFSTSPGRLSSSPARCRSPPPSASCWVPTQPLGQPGEAVRCPPACLLLCR